MKKMEQVTIERYVNGELTESSIAARPRQPTQVDVIRAEVEATIEERVTARIAALEQRTTGLDVAAMKSDLATLRERVDRAREQAAAINPNAVEEPGARSEIAKVKEALTPIDEPEEVL